MTREEEKYITLDTEQCKWWVNHLFSVAKEQACNSHNFDDAEKIQAAQDKIIKLLEQETIEVEAAKLQEVYNKGYADGQKALAEHIKLCQEEQEPKTGHWIMHIDDLFPTESTMECSECGEHQPLTIDDNYCPNCGAKMESEG